MSTANLPFDKPANEPTIALHHGDCLEVIPTLTANSLSLVFADMPYGTPHRKTTDMAWDKNFNATFFRQQAYECLGVNPIILTATQPFASLLIVADIKNFRYDLIWEKCKSGSFLNANRSPLRKHEHVLVFSKKPTKYNPIMKTGAPYTSMGGPPAKAFANRQTRNTVRLPTYNTGTRYPTSIIKFGPDKDKITHPTQKPIALLEWLIKTYTNPGDTVLDPVFGSCTTGVACLRTGRNFVGIEKDATYFEAGRKRIAEEQANLGFKVTV